jgi:hypothetical protein
LIRSAFEMIERRELGRFREFLIVARALDPDPSGSDRSTVECLRRKFGLSGEEAVITLKDVEQEAKLRLAIGKRRGRG